MDLQLALTLHRTEPAMACQRGRLCGTEYTKGPAEKMATQPADGHPALMHAPKLNGGIAIACQQDAPTDAAGRSRCCLAV